MANTAADRKKTENEAVFRARNEIASKGVDEVNRLIDEVKDGAPRISENLELIFQCECSDENCQKPISLNLATYNEIHENRSDFIVRPGHDVGSIETSIYKGKVYHIVRKHDMPPETNPRLSSTSVNNT